MSVSIPFIPDNAPFTSEQRAWLNGLLASLFSSAPIAPSEASAKRIAVLYASQSGTAEGLARKLAKELKALGHTPAVSTLVGYTPAALAAETHALILASTYGDGDAPDGVQPFYEQLCLEHFPRMEKLRYSVFSLGDKHYEHFCKFGSDLDAKLASLGANPIAVRVDSDVDVEQPFSHWKSSVLAQLNKGDREASSKTSSSASPNIEIKASDNDSSGSTGRSIAPKYTRDNPLLAPLLEKRVLTHEASTKATIHFAFSTAADGHFTYEAGDAFGVLPKNNPNLVAEILQQLRMNGNEQVTCGDSSTTTLHDALLRNLQITRLGRKLVQQYAKQGQCAALIQLLAPDRLAALNQYVTGRGLLDLLIEFPGVIEEPMELVGMLPRLTPRLYSISSSPSAHQGQIHATVAVVRYFSNRRERGGVCSTLLADRTRVSEKVPIYIQPNKKFRLPKDPDAPIIMIGPGTGIAPFRGFLHERRALGHTGRNWLFFGDRSASTDFLYRDELQGMLHDGHLSRLDTAFSRDQADKVYVQHRILQQSAMIWKWLEDGASIYVCGDASRMAKDVQSTILSLVEKEGGLTTERADEFVAELKEQHRYHFDVY